MVTGIVHGDPAAEHQGAVRAASATKTRRGWAQPALLALAFGLIVGLLAWRTGWPAFSAATAAPVRVDRPQLKLTPTGIDLRAQLFSAHDVVADGWFFVAAIGDPQPWNDYLYRSTTVEHPVTANGTQEFHWTDPLPVPKGVYQVTIWFHNVANGTSVHLIGGNFGLAPLLLGGDATLHEFEGSAAVQLSAQSSSYTDGRLSLQAQAHATAAVTQATLTWALRPADNDQAAPIFTGRPQLLHFTAAMHNSTAVALSDQLALPQGAYDLWLNVDSGDGHPQRAVIRKAVVQAVSSVYERQSAPVGGYMLALGAQPVLRSDWTNTLPVMLSAQTDAQGICRISWTLATDAGVALAHGDGGSGCRRPLIILPGGIDPGLYRLTLTAQAESAGASVTSDTITALAAVTR